MNALFDISDKVAVITGAGGVLCSAIAQHLAACGVKIVALDHKPETMTAACEAITNGGGYALRIESDVLQRESMECALTKALQEFGRVDFLINGAGGNHPTATTSADNALFGLPLEGFERVMNLNLLGTVLPCMVFGKHMADRKEGVILNVASMNAFRPLTRIPAYSAAKAAVRNFTEWLAVHMAQEYSPRIRVNAIAPGFFLTHQNRFLLTMPDTGELTPRGRQIIQHTPMGRFGDSADLLGTVSWLLAPASQFVTGITVPIDGGFNAYAGV